MTRHWLKTVFVAATLMLAAAPANAQEALKLKAGKAWEHRHSGISVPATLGGTPRTGGNAYAAEDLDVSLGFTVGDAVESLSFYVFRNTNGAVPVWFAQAQWGIENRDIYGRPTISLAPQAFVPPGQTTASGLKSVYEPRSGPYRSTGLMLLPVGDWYVKVRASSQTRSPEELAAWMDQALREVGWPDDIAAAPEAAPVTPCTTPLAFPVAAKDAPKDGAADLLGGLLGMIVSEKVAEETPESTLAAQTARWCRDSALDGNQAVYRRNEDSEHYLLAVGDNGNGIWVGPDPAAMLMAEGADNADDAPRRPRASITLMTAARNINYVAQDRLPSPQRVIELVEANRVLNSVSTWGDNRNIEINSEAM